MPCSNSCFLTCIRNSQKAGKVVCYTHLLKNFPQFIVTYTVKGFSRVNEAEVDVFLEFSCFFNDSVVVGNLISASLPFLNPTWTSGNSQLMYCWSLAWRILMFCSADWTSSSSDSWTTALVPSYLPPLSYWPNSLTLQSQPVNDSWVMRNDTLPCFSTCHVTFWLPICVADLTFNPHP